MVNLSKKKFYVVRKGYKVGIYNTWDECKKQVNGFSGAEYKSFQTLEEANEYMGVEKKINIGNGEFIEAYVDGSYEHSIKEYGSGVVILKNGMVEKKYSLKGNNKSLVSMRNVAGEIEASKTAMKYCIDNNIKHLKLYFDYEGIENDVELSVTLCDNEYIKALNKQHRNKDSATDVLSFPMYDFELEEIEDDEPLMLGDIVISLERAKEQAKEIGNTFLEEVAFLVVHSMLHLLGYDHERSPEDEEVQCEAQKEIFKTIEI